MKEKILPVSQKIALEASLFSMSGCHKSSFVYFSKIKNELDMQEALESLRQLIMPLMFHQLPYERMYRRLKQIEKKQVIMPFYLRQAYLSKNNGLYLLLCCIDSEHYFFKLIPPEEWNLWAEMSLFCESLIIPKSYLSSQCSLVDLSITQRFFNWHSNFPDQRLFFYDFLLLAARAGHQELVSFLLPKQKHIDLLLYRCLIYNAALSGQASLVRYLLEAKLLKSFQFNLLDCVKTNPEELKSRQAKTPICGAILSGNIDLVEWFIEFEETQSVKIMIPELLTVACRGSGLPMLQFIQQRLSGSFSEAHLQAACFSKNNEIFSHIASQCPTLVSERLLSAAARSKNAAIMKILLEHCPIKFDIKTLNKWIAPLGDLELFKNIVEKYQLSLNAETLLESVSSGSLPLASYLIESGLKPDYLTLVYAVTAGNHQLTHYLLTPPHGDCRIEPNEATLTRACLSGNTANIALTNCHNHFGIILRLLEPPESPRRIECLKELRKNEIFKQRTDTQLIHSIIQEAVIYAPTYFMARLRLLLNETNCNSSEAQHQLSELLDHISLSIKSLKKIQSHIYLHPYLDNIEELILTQQTEFPPISRLTI